MNLVTTQTMLYVGLLSPLSNFDVEQGQDWLLLRANSSKGQCPALQATMCLCLNTQETHFLDLSQHLNKT